MDDFTSRMFEGLKLLASEIAQWDEMTDDRLDEFEAQLNVFGDAISYERELREYSREEAGGADSRGDKNKATRI